MRCIRKGIVECACAMLLAGIAHAQYDIPEGMDSKAVTATEADDDTDPAYSLPWNETFEPLATGTLDGQHGWVAGAGAVVTDSDAQSGSQALRISEATVSHTFLGNASNVWMTFWAKPIPGSAAAQVPADAAAVFYIDDSNRLVAYDVTAAIVIPAATVSNGWNKFEVECNYYSRVWKLKLNGSLVVNNFDFYGTPAVFQELQIVESSTSASFVDEIQITDEPPAVGNTPLEMPYVANTNLSRAGWDAEGWRITKRSPSNYAWDNGEVDEGCDFTIFQATDGTWQIVGCVRNTTFPGFTRLLYQWETTDFFSSDWTEKGVLLTTSDPDLPAGIDYAEGTLQAPHVVKDGGLYYMIYNSANAHLMVSANGKDWMHQAASDGGYTLFNMNRGRDVMLMDNRDIDGKWYAVYCGKSDWNGTENTNYYHSATNIIGPWSGPLPMAQRDHWRHVESPFLFRRGGWYYLILQDEVFAQPSVTNFFGYPIFTDLGTYADGNLGKPTRGYAPEIIHHPNGQDYIAGYNNEVGEAWEGTEIRPLYWKWTDTDDDGLPDYWERQYYGGPTSAVPTDSASNGVNSVQQAYIAGIDPTDPDAAFLLSSVFSSPSSVLSWNSASGRVYKVYWTSNLLENFQLIQSNLSWTPAIFTDSAHSAEEKGFYKIEVELE